MTHPSFSLPDALQAGLGRLSSETPAFLRQHWIPVVLASVVLTVFSAIFHDANLSTNLRAFTGRNPDPGDVLTMLALGALGLCINFALICYLVVAAYTTIAGAGTSWAWKWGSAEPPLLGLTTAQAMMMRSAARRILSLWPGAVFVALWTLKSMISMEIALRFGNAPSQAYLSRNVLWVLSVFFLLWYISKVARNYLFRAPTIVETGAADDAQIARWVPKTFPRNLATGAFWSSAALILAAMVPIWLLRWLLSMAYEALDVAPLATLPVFVTNIVAFFAWAVASVFLAGALHHAWHKGALEHQVPA